MIKEETPKKNPWSWIPTLYYTQGLPYIMVVTVSVIMYKNLGISNAEIGLYTSLFYIPWMIKPLWSPFVDVIKTKRWWTYSMQLLIAVGFLGIVFSLSMNNFFIYSVIFFWIIAFGSSTHDIAADGFYMLALSEERQSFFVGIRSTFFRLAMISGEGIFVVVAGVLAANYFSIEVSWMFVFGMLGILMLGMGIYHKAMLPKPVSDVPLVNDGTSQLKAAIGTILDFFKKDQIVLAVLFILLYRFGEGQLVKIAAPFLLDPVALGGLGLSTTEVGVINGTIGLIALTIGGILGGIVISRHGLKFWLWPMIAFMNLPNAAYIALAYYQPESYWVISSLVGLEKFGYGFGFAAFLMYLIYISRGKFKTAHYAFGTALMAIGMAIPGAVSGYIQEWIGYTEFFVWVLISAIPIIIITPFIKIEDDFGKKAETDS